MKRFFSNKLNILLSIILVAVVSVAVVLTFKLFNISFSKEIVAIDFSGYTKSQVEAWINENGLKEENYAYSYAYDDEIEKDYVIYQSVKDGDVIDDKLTIIYSQGKDENEEIELIKISNGTSVEEVETWLKKNEFTNVSYLYETSDTHEFGTVISISPTKAKIDEEITVLVSYGSNIEDIETTVLDFSSYSKEEIENWALKYAINLKFNYESSDLANEDEYISQSIATNETINGGDTLIITLSSGKNDIKTATIEDDLLGESESNFLDTLKGLGFTSFNKSDTTYYSESLDKDSIYSYDDGNFPLTKTINYALCAGKYEFNSSEFNGKSKEEVQTLVNNLKKRNAKVNKNVISITFENGKEDASLANKTYDCSINESKISCKLYVKDGSEVSMIPDDGRYLGLSEEEFLSSIKELGYSNFKKSDSTYYSTTIKKGTVYSYDDGEIALSSEINYALSEGAYSFDASTFNGKTKEEAQTLVNNLKKRNAKLSGSLISISFVDGTSNKDKKGTTYDCSNSGSKITCKLYTDGSSSDTSKTATIPGNLLGYSETNFLNKLKELGFSNFNKSNTTYYSTTISSGSVYSYDDGTFDTSKTINYALSSGAYSFSASDYNGLSQSDITNKVNDQKNRNANRGNLSLNLINGDANSSKAGTTYNCSYSGTTISCYLYTSESTSTKINVENYVGKSIDNLKSWCGNNGLNISTSEQYSDTVASGQVISQSPSSGSIDKGGTISAVVSKGKAPEETTKVSSLAFIMQNCKGDNYDETASKVKSYFTNLGFSNITVNPITSTGPLNTISAITIGGINHVETGEYKKSSAVIIDVVKANS